MEKVQKDKGEFETNAYGYNFLITYNIKKNMVSAITYVDGVKIKGVAICREGDTFNLKYGQLVAIKSALCEVYARTLSRLGRQQNSVRNELDNIKESISRKQERVLTAKKKEKTVIDKVKQIAKKVKKSITAKAEKILKKSEKK